MNINVNLRSDEALFSRINAMHRNGITLAHVLSYLGVTKRKYGKLKQMFRNDNTANVTADLRLLFQIRSMQKAKVKLSLALNFVGLTHWQYGLLRQKLEKHTAWLDKNTSPDTVCQYLQEYSPGNHNVTLPHAA